MGTFGNIHRATQASEISYLDQNGDQFVDQGYLQHSQINTRARVSHSDSVGKQTNGIKTEVRSYQYRNQGMLPALS